MADAVFFGLGNMGLPMAVNLARRFEVRCFDLCAEARARGCDAGLMVAESVEEAVAGVAEGGVVFSMLPAGEFVEALLLGEEGVIALVRGGVLFVDCSTTAPRQARAFAEAAARRGAAFLDAPVSGGIGGARGAGLTFLCGGELAVFRRVRPMLSAMGKKVFLAGECGAGQAAKLCNNMMLSVQMAGACEALALGVELGLDAGMLSDIMRNCSGNNWVVEKYNPVPGVLADAPASHGYKGGFKVDLMVKDSDLALDEAGRAGVEASMARCANAVFRAHRGAEEGNGELDFSSVFKFVGAEVSE